VSAHTHISIGGCQIGADCAPFIIAELSGNHGGSLQRALETVDAVAKSGAQALKLQTYTADTMTIDVRAGDFFIDEEDSLWKGRSLYDLYRGAATPWEWHGRIFARASELGLVCFSSPFDTSAVDFLETLNVPAYKIASFENTDLQLIRKVASTGKPVIISTGLARLDEIAEAVAAAREAGCTELVLLKCTSSYPASPLDSHLLTIPHLRAAFGCEVGLSDHTLGIGAAIAAVGLGATVIEKHVTLNRSAGGVDDAFSLEPPELASLVAECGRARLALGGVHYGPTAAEVSSLRFRRSLYIVEDMRCGEVLTHANLRRIRPGYGLPPKYLEILIGKRVVRDVARGTPMSWQLIAD